MEESAPREQGQGIQGLFAHMDWANAEKNSSAPQNALLCQTAQGAAKRGFKNKHPVRGRKLREADILNNNSAHI